jgi:gamma-glutamylcyclotransferase (GGCT)/AIG2-like uncharacterized protein YtfP
MQHVFVYGTLKQGGYNNHILRNAKFIGKARTVADSYRMLNGGYPMVFADGKFHIRGEVFAVQDAETLRNLDRLEGVPHLFDRHHTTFEVEIDGKPDQIDGFMYCGNPKYGSSGRNPEVQPNEENELEWL